MMFLDPCFLQPENRFKEFVVGIELGLEPLLSSYGSLNTSSSELHVCSPGITMAEV